FNQIPILTAPRQDWNPIPRFDGIGILSHAVFPERRGWLVRKRRCKTPPCRYYPRASGLAERGRPLRKEPLVDRTAFSLTRDFLRLVRRHLRLLVVLSGREVTDRFAGSALGAVWALAHPLFLMALFVCVFTFIFGLRFANANTGLNYSVFLISGYLPW